MKHYYGIRSCILSRTESRYFRSSFVLDPGHICSDTVLCLSTGRVYGKVTTTEELFMSHILQEELILWLLIRSTN
jgi:hypothetical protein